MVDEKSRNRWICIGLSVATLAVYAQVVTFEFLKYDDPLYVTENPEVLRGLTARGVVWAFTTGQAAHWIPLTWLSHMVDCQLFGAHSAAHHLVNVLLHVANTLLLFRLLQTMTGATWRSALVAALFALHPLHVESVVWISQRKDMLSTLIGLGAVWVYVDYARQPSLGRYAMVALLLAVGLLAKPMLVTLPCVLLLLDYWPLARIRFGKSSEPMASPAPFPEQSIAGAVAEKIPLLALSAGSSMMTYRMMHAAGTVAGEQLVTLDLRIANAVVSYVRYLIKMVWPSGLSVLYPHPNLPGGTPWAAWQVAASAAILVTISVLVLLLARRYRYAPVGWLWYLGMLVPGIGLIQVGAQAMADSFTYLPLVGIFIILVWGGADVVQRWPASRVVSLGCAAGVLAALMVCSWFQLRHWHDSVTLFNHAVRVTPNNPVIYHNLGFVYQKMGKYDEALASYDAALKLVPDLMNSHVSRAQTFVDMNQLERAAEAYTEALKHKPEYAEVIHNRGTVYQKLGRLDLALQDYERSIELRPKLPHSYFFRAALYQQLNKPGLAIEDYTHAINVKPDLAEAYNNRGVLYRQLKRYPEAIEDFSKAIQIRWDYVAPYANRATTHYQLRSYSEAWDDVTKVRTLGGQVPPEFIQALVQASGRQDAP